MDPEEPNSFKPPCASLSGENGGQETGTTAARSEMEKTEIAGLNGVGGGTLEQDAYEALYSASSQSRSESDGEETLFEARSPVRQESVGQTGHQTTASEELKYQLLVEELEQVRRERDEMANQLAVIRTSDRKKEQSFQEIAKELEQKCFSQQEQLESLQEQQGEEQERSQKRTSELETRVDQVTAMYENAVREKEGVISKLALLEEGRRRLVDENTAAEHKHREDADEIERLQGVLKMQKAEVAKLKANCEKSEAKCTELGQDLTSLREEVSSLNIKVKWAQNKLRSETEAHKETKSQLTVTLKKLKESREEGEQIRADLKTMIIQYQESEEMRSNSLDIQLKKREKELKQNEQEIADQQTLHDLTVKELELTKAAHKISQEECQQHKNRISELNSRLSDHSTEIEELKAVIDRLKQDQKKLTTEMAGLEQLNHGIESERAKFVSLRDGFTQLQKSHQHLEREMGRRKEREKELLAFSEKLSAANAELQAERSNWEAKVSSLLEEKEQLLSSLAESQGGRESVTEELERVREEGQTQVVELVGKLEDKSRAVEQLSLALEDEREQAKALRKKNSSSIRDLQRQLQQSKRRIEHLESLNAAEREPPATLPITDGSRASSPGSLDGIGGATTTAIQLAAPTGAMLGNTLGTTVVVTTSAGSVQQGGPVAHRRGSISPDEERIGASPSPELFQTLDQEKMVLVERLCKLKREMAKQEEKMEFFEEHAQQLTEDIQRKSKIIQNFIMREQTGALAPPSYDEHKARHSRKGGIMATVFSGKHHSPDVTLELSLEMNRKMQSVLEDTLLKNITLKESIDTLGKEIQRLSAHLQTFENSGR